MYSHLDFFVDCWKSEDWQPGRCRNSPHLISSLWSSGFKTRGHQCTRTFKTTPWAQKQRGSLNPNKPLSRFNPNCIGFQNCWKLDKILLFQKKINLWWKIENKLVEYLKICHLSNWKSSNKINYSTKMCYNDQGMYCGNKNWIHYNGWSTHCSSKAILNFSPFFLL